MDNDLWIRHLKYQDTLFSFMDDELFFNDQDFLASTEVADLGSGYGFHLEKLHTHFTKKHFSAIDFDENAINHATANYASNKNVEFIQLNIESDNLKHYQGKFDFIIARNLVQHLTSLENFIKIIGLILRHKGTALIIDAYEPMKRFIPPVPTFSAIFKKFREKQEKEFKDGHTLVELPFLAKAFGLSISREAIIVGSTDTQFTRNQLYNVCRTNLDLIKFEFGVKGDFIGAHKELDAWYNHPNAYGSIGDYILKVQKNEK